MVMKQVGLFSEESVMDNVEVIKEDDPKVDELIKSSGTHIGYVEFIKRTTGKIRPMWFQGKITKKNLKGGNRAYSPTQKHLTFVFDIMKKGIRSVPWENVLKLSVNGKTYITEKGKKVLQKN